MLDLNDLRIVICGACGARWGVVGMLGISFMECPECGEACGIGEVSMGVDSQAAIWSN